MDRSSNEHALSVAISKEHLGGTQRAACPIRFSSVQNSLLQLNIQLEIKFAAGTLLETSRDLNNRSSAFWR
ncbi:hypothetical protein HAX54_023490 [Datura stramonium]|uniref:Uncharacterized protein n=1 Tax=Datura stramonium TaxID=4076 RepID=A0ABS8UYJ1_DATST|nr:hypothetical protein [Datura stramonium]